MLIRSTTSTSMVAAAVAALFLAGCGGGSDNGSGAGAESGGLSTKTNGSAAAGTNTVSGAGTTTGTAEAGATGEAAQTASSHAPITEAGISTELFEKILSTQTAYVRVGPHAYPISSNHAASQLVSPDEPLHPEVDRNAWMENPDLPDMLSYQQPVGGKFTVHSWGADRSGQNADGKIISAVASFGYVFHQGADATDRRLTLTTEGEISNGYSRDANTGEETYRETDTVKADAEKVIPRDGVLNFDEAIQEWSHPTGNAFHGGQMKLFVQRGDSPDEVMFCLKMDSRLKNLNADDPASPPSAKSDVQRTVCSLWQVPANWTARQSLVYNGIFVSENLDVEGNVNAGNTRYWKTRPVSAATQGAAAAAGQAADSAAATAAAAGAAAVNAASAAANAGEAVQNAASQATDAVQADVTSQAAAEAAAAADAAGNAAESVSTESGHAAAVAQQHGQAADAAAQPATGDASAAAPTDAAQPAVDAARPAVTDTATPAQDAAAQTGGAAPEASPPAVDTVTTAPAADAGNPAAAPATDAATEAATEAAASVAETPAADAAAQAPAADAAAARPDTLDSK